MIEFRDLSFRYPRGSVLALDRIDLDLGHGFTLICGASGSGKSTLARILCGLSPRFTGGAVSGHASISGIDLARLDRDLADVVGFVPQESDAGGVAERVDDELAFTAENLGSPAEVIDARIAEALAATGLSGLRTRRLRTLSGGERQGVAITAALVARPDILVLDEPTSQLDDEAAARIVGLLRTLSTDHAIVCIEHRIDRIRDAADRIVVLDRGRVVADGDPGTLDARGVLPTLRPMPAGSAVALGPVPLGPVMLGPVVVEARDVSVRIGDATVLDRVDLTVRSGEVVSLRGPNGSGKTTLLRALLGLVAADGIVRTEGDVAYLPQRPEAIFCRETLGDEIRFSLRCRGLPTDPVPWLRRAHLEAFANASPRKLSAGEQLRAAACAATAGDPAIVLLDEPTRGLDVAGHVVFISLIETWRKAGRAVVLATHDRALADAVATRTIRLDRGRIVEHEAVTA